MCHCLLAQSERVETHMFEYHSLLFGDERRRNLEHLFDVVGSEFDPETGKSFTAMQKKWRQDGAFDRSRCSPCEHRIIDLLETDRLHEIFSGFIGTPPADARDRMSAWLTDYTEKAVEIEDLILRELDTETGGDPWEGVRGLMMPFGHVLSSTLAFGLPYRSAFTEIPRLRTRTKLGQVLSRLRGMVTPDAIRAWNRGDGAEHLSSIFAALEGRLWRSLACAILLQSANLAGARRAVRLIRKTYRATP